MLIIWNRGTNHDSYARQFEAVGAKVIVAENGYIGKDEGGHKLYAMALGHHLGLGTWPVGERDRWSPLGIPLKPWRENGEHILVLAQRGIGERGIAQPRTWPKDVMDRLSRATKRPIRLRDHPGKHLRLNDSVLPPLEPDLKNCWAAVVWGSGAGIKSIVSGIPVFYELKGWVGAGAAKFGIEEIEQPWMGDRMPMLHRLSWGIWSAKEIATGEPIKCLLAS